MSLPILYHRSSKYFILYFYILYCFTLFYRTETRIIERTTPENYKPIINDYFNKESPIHSQQAQEDEANLMPDTLPPPTKRNVNDPEIIEATHVSKIKLNKRYGYSLFYLS